MSKKDFKIKEITSWHIIEDCLAEKTASGYKMALIESEKLLQDALKQAGYPGKNGDERIASSGHLFSNIKKLKSARDKAEIVLRELDYNLNSLEVEEATKAYHQALMDIKTNPDAHLGFFDRIWALITYYIPSKKKLFFTLAGISVGTLLFIVFLADTKTGRNFATSIVDFAHFVFSWVITTAILIIAVITIITLTILYFENKRKGQSQEYEL